jgi:uncharacterized protein YraI
MNLLGLLLVSQEEAQVKKFLMSLAAIGAMFVAPTIADAAVRGQATANVNMRSGPSTQYPAVVVIPVGSPITINGCMSTVNWCDVSFAGGRGWVSGNYIQATYRSNRVYIAPDYYRGLGIPTVTFDVNTYWGRHYRDRDFYRERDRWRRYDWRSERPLPPPPRWERDRDRDRGGWDRDRDRNRDRGEWRPGDRQPPAPPRWDRDRDRDQARDRDRDRGREQARDRDRDRDNARDRDRNREIRRPDRGGGSADPCPTDRPRGPGCPALPNPG